MATENPVRIAGHHLIPFRNFYLGRDESAKKEQGAKFAKKTHNLYSRLLAQPQSIVLIVVGGDDICKNCSDADDSCSDCNIYYENTERKDVETANHFGLKTEKEYSIAEIIWAFSRKTN